MKILFYQRSDVINSSGGTEKVLCNLSSLLAENGYDVIFMTNENKAGKPFFSLSNNVKFINIGGTTFCGFRKLIFKLIKSTPILKIFKYFNNYDWTSNILYKNIGNENPDIIILANPSDLLDLCYSNKYKAPIIQMIHGVPWNIFHRRSKRILRETLRVMKNVSVCQVLMPSFVKLMKPFYNGKIVLIPNIVPTPIENINCDYDNNKEKLIICNVGRTAFVKNQKLIIEAFSKISDKYKNWEVNIWGGGDNNYKLELEKIIKENNLENIIIFKGLSKNIIEELTKADIFAFPSLFEGFPLALTEAMSVGLSSIGLKEAPAVNEIIIDAENGLLAENNIDDFANKLEELMNREELRKKLGQSAKNSMKNYDKEKIMSMWKKLIKEISEERKR